MTLSDYIKTHYGGNKSAFARDMGTIPQQVYRWEKLSFVVIDGWLYSRRRPIKKADDE